MCKRVYTYSEAINVGSDLHANFSTLCDVLVLNMGSNDLANMDIVDNVHVSNLAKLHYYWCMNSGARRVLCLGVLPRSQRLRGSVAVFDANRDIFNEEFRKLCCRQPRVMTFRRIRGFEADSDHHTRVVDAWSKDGIHPYSWDKYIQRLRHAMMDAVKPLLN